MPLDWAEVKKRYEGGTRIPTVAGGRSLEITGVDGRDDEFVAVGLGRYRNTAAWHEAALTNTES